MSCNTCGKPRQQPLPKHRPCECKRCSPIYHKGDCCLCYLYDYEWKYHYKWSGENLSHIKPVSDTKINGLPERNFNGSIAEWRGKTYLAFRRYWDRARIALVELGTDWQPKGDIRQLQLGKLREDLAAQEDPRLFVYRDELHCAYTGCSFDKGQLKVSICYARLNENLEVEDSIYPKLEGRQEWEKNWGFFESDGDLYTIHTIHRRILLMTKRTAIDVATEAHALPVSHHARGGASPILHNGEYYSFYHGVQDGVYSMGLYTFSPTYPFKPLRYSPVPLLYPHPGDRPPGHVAIVVFPGGAIHRGDCWSISYGNYDRETRVITFRDKDIEGMLTPFSGG